MAKKKRKRTAEDDAFDARTREIAERIADLDRRIAERAQAEQQPGR